jgi:hypothetical protein
VVLARVEDLVAVAPVQAQAVKDKEESKKPADAAVDQIPVDAVTAVATAATPVVVAARARAADARVQKECRMMKNSLIPQMKRSFQRKIFSFSRVALFIF